jgi:hypothetical protein
MDTQLNQYFNVLHSLIDCFLTPALAIFQLYRSVRQTISPQTIRQASVFLQNSHPFGTPGY